MFTQSTLARYNIWQSQQFDSIPVNVVAVQQQQVADRPRRFGDGLPRGGRN
jgi:small subunit ribosomal protein S17e